jgi:DNA-binding transcriptional ArsR family regulator
MAFKPREIAMTIPQAISSQQSNKLPNNTAKNTKIRTKEIDVSLAATIIKAATQETYFSQVAYVDFKAKDLDGGLAKDTVSRKIKLFIEYGIIEKLKRGFYRLTALGKILHERGFKYHLERIADIRRRGKEEVKKYLKSMSDGTLFQSSLQSNLLASVRSYIELTKERISSNISHRHPSACEKSLSLNTDERMFRDIKKRNPDIEDQDLELVFSLVRGNVGFIKNDLWLEEFNQCIKDGLELYTKFEETFKDKAETFIKAWRNAGKRGWFKSANKLKAVLNSQYEKRCPKEIEKWTEEQWNEKIDPTFFQKLENRVINANHTHCVE